MIAFKNSWPIGVAGLVITYLFQITTSLAFLTRSTADTESKMTSVERIMTYSKTTPQEQIKDNVDAPEDWPTKGNMLWKVNISNNFFRFFFH